MPRSNVVAAAGPSCAWVNTARIVASNGSDATIPLSSGPSTSASSVDAQTTTAVSAQRIARSSRPLAAARPSPGKTSAAAVSAAPTTRSDTTAGGAAESTSHPTAAAGSQPATRATGQGARRATQL